MPPQEDGPLLLGSERSTTPSSFLYYNPLLVLLLVLLVLLVLVFVLVLVLVLFLVLFLVLVFVLVLVPRLCRLTFPLRNPG